MQIYLPIAELSVNVLLFLGMGGAVGFLSGLFGVGGGFLMTPLLIFTGIPPVVAVATEANQIVASSFSGALAHWRRAGVDIRMGLVLLAGGIAGSLIGIELFTFLRDLGQVDLLISLCYVLFLGIIGLLMLIESLGTIRQSTGNTRRPPSRKRRSHNWVQRLPLRMRFYRSKLYISVLPPLAIGFTVGVLAAIMGVGGGFIIVPAMIYLLRMPTNIVIGTSLFQITFVTGLVTLLHATQNRTVDIVLAVLLLTGGVIGAQIGVRAGQKLKAEQLRALLALMVLLVCAKLLFDLTLTPEELYSITTGGHQ